MDALVLARWQFGITTVYHFLFVPMTIGITWLVAIMQTKWTNTGSVAWYRLTRLFGKIFLINFAAGVVTGIVQEFQFGMNWSEYSRFVGDIFGAPLALEALIAFFMESTFVGLWIFGWNKLSKKAHLVMIYLTAIGSTISAIFILAANSWMQNPVGAQLVQLPDGSYRAQLHDFMALVTNPFFLVTFPHVLAAAFMLAGGMVLGVSGWWLANGRKKGEVAADDDASDTPTWRMGTRFGAWAVLIASIVSIVVGDIQGKVEASYQPLKLAASEGVAPSTVGGTVDGGAFAIVSVFSGSASDGTAVAHSIAIPGLLSFLAGGPATDINALAPSIKPVCVGAFGQVDGTTCTSVASDQAGGVLAQGFMPLPTGTTASTTADPNDLQKAVSAMSSDTTMTITAIEGANTAPSMWASFYTFRFMILFGFLGLIFSIIVLAKTKKGSLPTQSKGWSAFMWSFVLMPLVASSCGWLVTELGRQPWIVYGVLPTSAAVSPGVTGAEVLISMILYTLIYAAVAVIVVQMFLKTIRHGLPDGSDEPGDQPADNDAILHFAY
ncbi:MAG: cytochrome ubiquinol oxidase subunit I [Propionibacteriaceae bacterium]|nr:cytochrome ubiquinol oxidase subunit I [Propionibacteriaceae bacterium]